MIQPQSQIWTTDTISDIHSRAQGKYKLSNFKTFRELVSFDELVFLASGLTRFPLEGYKEKCKTQTVLGTRFSTKPFVIDTPIYVQSNGNLPDEVRIALARGSSLASTALSIGGKMLSEERKATKKLVYEISAENHTPEKSRFFHVIKADAIQVNVSYQTDEEKLEELIRKIRRETERMAAIFVGIPAGQISDDVRAAAKAGADGIVLEALKSTIGLSPESVLNYCRMPIAPAIARAREALRENKLLGEVNLIAATGIRNGADAAKALALGADSVVINESALIALNYLTPIHHELTFSPEELIKGKEIQGKELNREPRPDVTGERLAKFMNSMTMEIALLARSLGKGDVHSLEHEDLSALTVEASMMTGIRLSGE